MRHRAIEPEPPAPRIVVAIASAHVYLTQGVIETLFCDHYRLHQTHRLSQAPQFSTLESVSLIGPRGRIDHIPVIGPARLANQIEISPAQAHLLGVEALLRDSGDLLGTHGITVQGPRASLQLKSGVICVHRHLHLDPCLAEQMELKDKARVHITKKSAGSPPVFRRVLVRVAPGFVAELHLNGEEAKAVDLKAGDRVFVSRQLN